MRALFLLLTACWTRTLQQPMPPNPPSPTCEVHDGSMVLAGPVVLAIRGMQFAHVDGAVARLDVTVKGVETQARVENTALSLVGELELDGLFVRPKQIELRDGWLEISRANAKRAKGGSLEIEVPLPAGIEPQTITVDVPCDQLTFASPPPLAPNNGAIGAIDRGTPLHRTLDGKVVARLAHADPIVDGRVVEHDDHKGWLRLRIEGQNAIVVWTPSNSVEKLAEGHESGAFGGGRGVGGGGEGVMTCTREVPLYVESSGSEVRVGHVKADVPVYTRGPAVKGRIELELGGRDSTPYVKDVAACTVQPAG